MRTVRSARLVMPGARRRLYEIDLVEATGASPERYLVNFRYGWDGGVLQEGTRTTDPVTEDNAQRIFDSLIVSRQNLGYVVESGDVPERRKPELTVVTEQSNPRDEILAHRMRGFDGLPDLKAAGLLHRLGELRAKSQAPAIAAAAAALIGEKSRVVALRTLPYALHRTDDGSGSAGRVLEHLSASDDGPTAETAQMLRMLRELALAPDWSAYPAVLQGAVKMEDPNARNEAAIMCFAAAVGDERRQPLAKPTHVESVLRTLYVHGAYDPLAREVGLAVLKGIPLRVPLFRALRRILQVAEATDDAEVFAILNARFDGELARNVFLARDSKNRNLGYATAYADKTRRYLRRRSWRTLRRLGRDGDAAYIKMAEAILMTLDDGEIEKNKPAGTSPQAGPHPDHVERLRPSAVFPPFANRYAAIQIMYGRGMRVVASDRSLSWRYAQHSGPAQSEREEPFPDLWVAHPASLWRIIMAARANVVADFAARVLREDPLADTISVADVIALLGAWRPYTVRRELAIKLAERCIARDGLTLDLAAALLGDGERGGALLKLLLTASPGMLIQDPALFAVLIGACAAVNHYWFDPLAEAAAADLSPEARRDVLDRVFAGLQPAAWPPDEMTRAIGLAKLLTKLFPAEIGAMDGEVLRRLSQQPSQPLQAIAAHLAAHHPNGMNFVDVGALVASENPSLVAAAISILGKRPIDALAADVAAIAAFLTAPAPEPRAAALPLAARLQNERPEAAIELAEMLLPTIYRTEQHENLREDVLAVLTGTLRPSVIALGHDTVWTLLRARSEPARRLGASVLDGLKPQDFSVRQLARIACNDQVIARRFAVAALQARVDDVRHAPEDAFAMLDCPFDDTREAGFTLYRTQLKPEDWTPTALVALADATTEPAQRFGREMIGRVFEDKNADFLLSRLAEHPAAGFRLFVARLMRDYVQGDTHRLKRLVPAIETTLLQVRKGRAAKQQVLSFIEEQLARDGDEQSAVLAPILERVVATCAVEDRARIVTLLTKIKHRDAALVPRVALVPREAR